MKAPSVKLSVESLIANEGPWEVGPVHGDIYCRYCDCNKSAGEGHKKACPWPEFEKRYKK